MSWIFVAMFKVIYPFVRFVIQINIFCKIKLAKLIQNLFNFVHTTKIPFTVFTYLPGVSWKRSILLYLY
jgi:hypothetical protein